MEEAKVSHNALLGCVDVERYPDRSVIRTVLRERVSTRFDGGWFKIATALARSHREVVDLDDSRKVGGFCISADETHRSAVVRAVTARLVSGRALVSTLVFSSNSRHQLLLYSDRGVVSLRQKALRGGASQDSYRFGRRGRL